MEHLLPQQKNIPCLVENAEKPLLTGKQAECHAKHQIGIDLTLIDNGNTYFEDHYNGYPPGHGWQQPRHCRRSRAPENAELVKTANDIQRVGELVYVVAASSFGWSP